MKQDQMSMAASIESRVPFLDHKLVEFTARIPARCKIRGFTGKYLLRQAMKDTLPAAVLHRNKKGFPMPIRPWLQHQLFDKLCGILTGGRLAERQLINPEYVFSLLAALHQGSSQAAESCWRLLSFELWSRIFLDRDTSQIGLPAMQMNVVVLQDLRISFFFKPSPSNPKIKILLPLPSLFFPADTGGKIRSLNIFSRLGKRAEIHAVSFADPARDEAGVTRMKELFASY